jgi:glycosyltransferase involved in cell wall biosynthesis
MNLTEVIKVHGNQPKEVVSMAYKTAHFSFLLSQSEGWPKVVAEAMWHGCIPVSTPVSCVPWMLNIPFNDNKGNQNASDRLDDGSQHDPPRGLLHFSKEQTIFELESLIKSERHYHNMQEAAMNFSQQYTMESFETAIRKLIYA